MVLMKFPQIWMTSFRRSASQVQTVFGIWRMLSGWVWAWMRFTTRRRWILGSWSKSKSSSPQRQNSSSASSIACRRLNCVSLSKKVSLIVAQRNCLEQMLFPFVPHAIASKQFRSTNEQTPALLSSLRTRRICIPPTKQSMASANLSQALKIRLWFWAVVLTASVKVLSLTTAAFTRLWQCAKMVMKPSW